MIRKTYIGETGRAFGVRL